MPDFCVAEPGGVVLQSGGLGHFPVLISGAVMREGFCTCSTPGDPLGGFREGSVIKMPLHHHCCPIRNETAFTLRVNVFFLKLPNAREAPNFQK